VADKTVLLIGGSADGRRVEINAPAGAPFMFLPDQPLPSVVSRLQTEGTCETSANRVRAEWYEPARLNGQTKHFTVYALRGLDGDDIMAALIGNYANG
jgi:hypothetical protein